MLLSISIGSIQFAEGFGVEAAKLHYDVQRGETAMLTWTIFNSEDKAINIEIYAKGEGSELLVFEEFITLEINETKKVEIFVIVPEDHPDNVEYHPKLFALLKGFIEPGKSGIVINSQMLTLPIIRIGDNPIYTPPVVDEIIKDPVDKIEEKPVVEKIKEETIEEKLARIQAANEQNKVEEKPITQTIPTQDKTIKENEIMDPEPTLEPLPKCGAGTEIVDGICKVIKINEPQGGGCLIATATYGSELAPQVQYLRELRDNTLFSTASGTAFMESFNQVYYSFSPSIADMQRENPMFNEAVKLVLTPMLSTLSIMTLAEDGSESSILGLGISVIALNVGIYLGVPAIIIHRLKK